MQAKILGSILAMGVGAAAGCVGVGGHASSSHEVPRPQRVALFNGDDLSGWHADVPEADGDAGVHPSFVVEDGLLISRGTPPGHLITDASFRDYRLVVEYRWPGTPGNCGILVHASTPRRLYKMFPQSIECQMHVGNAGDFWCIGEDIAVPDMEQRRGPRANWGVDEGKGRRVRNLTDDSEHDAGEWNEMVIECRGRTIEVWVNGDLVNHGTDCTADHGQIAIQAEGARCEFRRVELTGLLGGAAADADDHLALHLGGCILRDGVGPVPDDVYHVGEIEETDEYAPFTKKLSVYGITLVGRDDISDEFMKMVAAAIAEMFPRGGAIDADLQRELLTNLARYRTVIPFFRGENFEFVGDDENAWDRTRSRSSICDIIMQGVPNQTMEVVEHILHHVTDIGLHYTFPREWGISGRSELARAMRESIEQGYYEIEQYDDIDESAVKERVLLQEFAYWIITAAWNLQEPYGPADAEWKRIRTAADLEAGLPRSHALVRRTLPRVMAAPSKATLDAFAAWSGDER